MHSVSVTAPLILSINSFLRLVVLQRQVILEKCFVSAYTTEPTETKTSSRLFFIYKRPAISAKLARLCVVIPVGKKQIQEEKSWEFPSWIRTRDLPAPDGWTSESSVIPQSLPQSYLGLGRVVYILRCVDGRFPIPINNSWNPLAFVNNAFKKCWAHRTNKFDSPPIQSLESDF